MSDIRSICAEVKRFEADAVTRDVECDCDGSDPLNYHTENCALRREMQRSVTARARRNEYYTAAAPQLVEWIERVSRPELWPHQRDQIATAWMSTAPRVAACDIEEGTIIDPDNTEPLRPFGECGDCPEWSEVREEALGEGVCCCAASPHNGNGRKRGDKPCFWPSVKTCGKCAMRSITRHRCDEAQSPRHGKIVSDARVACEHWIGTDRE